jgi:hypothetical protein
MGTGRKNKQVSIGFIFIPMLHFTSLHFTEIDVKLFDI